MSTPELTLPAPAKINLFLHICGRRADGYHNLQTIFQFLSIADELSFRRRNDGQIHLAPAFADLPAEDNLIVKAARALQAHTGCRLGADIHINKQLPMGGGIGGGSSNAATTLVALNLLWQLGLARQTLQEIGLHLGADVPIFIHGHAAWAEGVGEKLVDVDLPEQWYLLVIPHCHVSTAKIFSHPQLTRNSKIKKIAAFFEQGPQQGFRNDCEALVRSLYPQVDEALNVLSQFGNARMTGTGACVYSRFNSEQAAREAKQQLPPHFNALVCQSLNRSPLYQAKAKAKAKE